MTRAMVRLAAIGGVAPSTRAARRAVLSAAGARNVAETLMTERGIDDSRSLLGQQ